MIAAWKSLTLSQQLLTIMMVTLCALMVWFHTRRGKEYDVLDILIDQTSHRASLDAHVTMLFALLAFWWVIDKTMEGVDVGDKLIEVLMIFVIYRAANKAINAYGSKPVAPILIPPAPDLPSPVSIDMTQNAAGAKPEQAAVTISRPKSEAPTADTGTPPTPSARTGRRT